MQCRFRLAGAQLYEASSHSPDLEERATLVNCIINIGNNSGEMPVKFKAIP